MGVGREAGQESWVPFTRQPLSDPGLCTFCGGRNLGFKAGVRGTSWAQSLREPWASCGLFCMKGPLCPWLHRTVRAPGSAPARSPGPPVPALRLSAPGLLGAQPGPPVRPHRAVTLHGYRLVVKGLAYKKVQ